QVANVSYFPLPLEKRRACSKVPIFQSHTRRISTAFCTLSLEVRTKSLRLLFWISTFVVLDKL
ncbi:hypothetical protein HHI36_013087, partial [Cryptolaemus montrouzieri]